MAGQRTERSLYIRIHSPYPLYITISYPTVIAIVKEGGGVFTCTIKKALRMEYWDSGIKFSQFWRYFFSKFPRKLSIFILLLWIPDVWLQLLYKKYFHPIEILFFENLQLQVGPIRFNIFSSSSYIFSPIKGIYRLYPVALALYNFVYKKT